MFRYLLQFYLNFGPKTPHCFLTHSALHLLKTFELFNYAFNVFVSIVSGKHGRHELFNMLFCRSNPTKTTRFTASKLVVLSAPHSLVLSKSHQQRLNNKSEKNPPTKPLLPILNHNNSYNHYHYQ